jgi:hypothetical protein
VQPLCVNAVILHHENILRRGLFAIGEGVGLVVEALCLGTQVAYLGLGLLALGNGQAVVNAIEVVIRRGVGSRGATTRENHPCQNGKNQLFHGRLLYVFLLM